ncbi:MAG: pantoate--beta-alanine ligase [Pseudomonadota bacterium]
MQIIKTIKELRSWREPLWPQGKTLSFVPTMGALHEGHLSLVREGLEKADICLPYIFLNPKQFAEGEDLDAYPKTLDEDLEKLSALGIETVYVPDAKEIYPDGFQTTVSVSDIAKPLEGKFRPDFFNGVTTVVCKMLLQALPEIALFGEKDFQQLQVIKQMVKDLNIPVKVIGSLTIRDENGLALSSRNAYLSTVDYNIAIQLNVILKKLADRKFNEKEAAQALLNAGFDKVDYCVLRNSKTLLEEGPLDRALAAAWIGSTRLIDNIIVTA